MLAEREGAFVENFLRAFQLLRTAAQNHHLVQAWLVRVLHAFQSLRLSRKSRFLSKTLPFLFQLSGIGMFLAVLLPILEPPVPPDSCTFRPRSPRLAAHRFVESPLFISNILKCHFSHSSTVRSPRSKMKRIARTARPKSLSHPSPPSCHKNPRICQNLLSRFSNFLECRFSFCPRRLHRSWMSLSTAPFVPGDCAARLHSSPAKSGVVEIPFLIF